MSSGSRRASPCFNGLLTGKLLGPQNARFACVSGCVAGAWANGERKNVRTAANYRKYCAKPLASWAINFYSLTGLRFHLLTRNGQLVSDTQRGN